MDPRIIEYYKLCSARNGARSHIVNQMRKELVLVMKKKETDVYFIDIHDKFVVNETVIGGSEKNYLPCLVI